MDLSQSFRLDELLGRGLMGEIHKWSSPTGQVAVKSFLFQHWMQRELCVISILDHPNIIKFFSAGFEISTQRYVIVYEYLDQTLEDNFQTLFPKPAYEVAIQIGRAVSYLQERQLCHCDIKPRNIMISGDVIKLIDFGSCQLANIFTGDLAFTLIYAEPGLKETNVPSINADVWSLGVVLIKMLHGDVKSAMEDLNKTSLPFTKMGVFVMKRMLHLDPAKRVSGEKVVDFFTRNMDENVRVTGYTPIPPSGEPSLVSFL